MGSVVTVNVSVALPEARMSDAVLNVSVPGSSLVSGLGLRRVVSARVVVNGSTDSSPSSVLVSSCSGVGSGGSGVQSYLDDLSGLSVVRLGGPLASWYRAPLCVLRNVDRDVGVSGAGEILEVVLEATVENVSAVSRGASIDVDAAFVTQETMSSESASLSVLEPDVSVSVSPASAVGDGGDAVQMVVVVNATQGAGYNQAYWVRLVDASLPGPSYVVESVVVDGTERYNRETSGSVIGHSTSGEWAVLESVVSSSVLVYRVRLTDAAASGTTVPTDVRVEWSSHPVVGSSYGVSRNESSEAPVSTAVSVPGPGLVWNASV